jgi:drug/metabolite transporter (DMT)-like permease
MSFLWISATLVAAAAQTFRNAAQKSLTAEIGTVGATQVRFLFGLPFAALFLAVLCLVSGRLPPAIGMTALLYTCLGSLTQIGATALMLTAMKEKSFSVTTAYTKTEPVLAAIVGLALLGDMLTPMKAGGIAIATVGILVMSIKVGGWREMVTEVRPALIGIGAGAMFGMSAVAFRGAIISLPDGGFVLRATTILALALSIQTGVLLAYLLLANRSALAGSFRVWKQSLGAGFLGALASQFWFIGFALTSAANVRTLALIEIFFAQLLSRQLFAQQTTGREYLGMGLIVLGVGFVLLSA